MRRALPLLLPLYVGVALFGANATAHPTTPAAAAADMTTVARPSRARWERSSKEPIRVFIVPARSLVGWTPALAEAVWAGFRGWTTEGVPVRFSRASSSTAADVVVEWVVGLPGKSIGKTWREDVGSEISTGRITLALYDHRGRTLSANMQRGAALHEIGHLLGLDHVASQRSIMYPQVWITEIADGDRVALKTLYAKRGGAVAD